MKKLKLFQVNLLATSFNTEVIEHKNIKFQIWDLAGQNAVRPYWSSYYSQTHAIIFVVDSTDKNRLSLAFEELSNILNVILKG